MFKERVARLGLVRVVFLNKILNTCNIARNFLFQSHIV